MFCHECGTKAVEGAKFCIDCGSRLVLVDEVIAQTPEPPAPPPLLAVPPAVVVEDTHNGKPNVTAADFHQKFFDEHIFPRPIRQMDPWGSICQVTKKSMIEVETRYSAVPDSKFSAELRAARIECFSLAWQVLLGPDSSVVEGSLTKAQLSRNEARNFWDEQVYNGAAFEVMNEVLSGGDLKRRQQRAAKENVRKADYFDRMRAKGFDPEAIARTCARFGCETKDGLQACLFGIAVMVQTRLIGSDLSDASTARMLNIIRGFYEGATVAIDEGLISQTASASQIASQSPAPSKIAVATQAPPKVSLQSQRSKSDGKQTKKSSPLSAAILLILLIPLLLMAIVWSTQRSMDNPVEHSTPTVPNPYEGMADRAFAAKQALQQAQPPATSDATQSMISEVQAYLQRLGYGSGSVDGIYGPRTASAIRAFQRDQELFEDGKVTEELLNYMRDEVEGEVDGISHRADQASAEEAKVTLLEPGAEPRIALAFKAAKDLNQLSRLTIKSSKEQVSGAGERMSMTMPGLKLELGCLINALDEAGIAKVRETLHRAEVTSEQGADPNAVQMFQQTYSQLEGTKSEAEIKSTGERVATDAAANPTGGGNVGDVTASFAIIFPAEPVGVGAKWEVASNLDQQGLKLSMKSAYEVTALEGDKLSVKVVMSGESPSQDLALPNLPPNAKAELVSAGLSGEGTADYDLTRLIPVKAAQTLSNNAKIKIINGTELIELEQIIKVDQTIEDINELSPKPK